MIPVLLWLNVTKPVYLSPVSGLQIFIIVCLPCGWTLFACWILLLPLNLPDLLLFGCIGISLSCEPELNSGLLPGSSHFLHGQYNHLFDKTLSYPDWYPATHLNSCLLPDNWLLDWQTVYHLTCHSSYQTVSHHFTCNCGNCHPLPPCLNQNFARTHMNSFCLDLSPSCLTWVLKYLLNMLR